MTTARVFKGPEGWTIRVHIHETRIEISARYPDGCEVPAPESDYLAFADIGCEADLAGRISVMATRIQERIQRYKRLGEVLENLTVDGKVDE